MRVVYVTTEYVSEDYFSGGLANYVYRISNAMARRGHDVHVIVSSSSRFNTYTQDNVVVHRLGGGLTWKILRNITFHRIGYLIRSIQYNLQVYRKLRALHKREPIDVIQFPNLYGCSLLPSLLLDIPYVVRMSTYQKQWRILMDYPRGLDAFFEEFIEKIVLRTSRDIICPSEFLKKLVEKEEKTKDIKVVRTPIWVEEETLDHSISDGLGQGDYMLYIGRLQLHKGVGVLAESLPQVLEKNRGVQVVFAGKDDEQALGKSMAEHIKSVCGDFRDRLVFLGQIRHNQLYPVIEKAKFVVLPSLIDNMPNAALESMVLGKPVLGTYGTSFEEIIEDEVDGFLTKPGDSEKLSEKIDEILKRKDLEEIGKNAKDKMREYNEEKIVDQLEEYYENIMSSNTG